MRIHVLTLFPEMIESVMQQSILGRAQKNGLIDIKVINIRDFARDKHRTADDYPYGGGAGMLLKPEPIFAAFDAIKTQYPDSPFHAIFMTPQGHVLKQAKAAELAQHDHLVILCGHYEGVDERVREVLIDEEISIGDFVLTGGELPAMVTIDALSRHLPGVLGNAESFEQDSFMNGLLDYPQYTRPNCFRGLRVPEVLQSGNHQHIAAWRAEKAYERTLKRRPDLLQDEKSNKV